MTRLECAGPAPEPVAPRVGLTGDDGPAAATLARVRAEAGGVPVVYRALGNAPTLLDAWIGLGWTLRKDVVADRALCELAVLRVAQLCGSDYVWRSHYRMALKEGVPQDQVDALGSWRTSDAYGQVQRAVLALTDELTLQVEATDGTWAAVAAHLGDREAVEVVLTVSWYACVARTVAALRIPLEPHHVKVPAVPVADVATDS
jgi:4-carboxymuconolactone decarboxylase